MTRRAIRLCATFLASTGIVLALKVTTDFDRAADFSRYRTYSWSAIEAGDSLWADRLRSAVDLQLLNRGWKKVPSNGDVSVTAFSSTEMKPEWRTFYQGYGGYWSGFADGFATTTVQYVPVGNVAVDILDSKTKKLIWRGTSTDTLSRKPEKNIKKLSKAVVEMFEKFPPRPKG